MVQIPYHQVATLLKKTIKKIPKFPNPLLVFMLKNIVYLYF